MTLQDLLEALPDYFDELGLNFEEWAAAHQGYESWSYSDLYNALPLELREMIGEIDQNISWNNDGM